MTSKGFPVLPPKKKYKMPTAEEFLDMKTMYNPRKKPVWVYLDREMRGNQEIKPYNEKVGIWLRFLKELRYYNECQQKRILKQINKECGPVWYLEFSSHQKNILADLKGNIYKDIIDERPSKVRAALWNLGLTLKIPSVMLMQAMHSCEGDSGVFIWNLYTAIYNKTPSVLRKSYDINAKVLMSALVFIDIEECLEMFEKITQPDAKKKPPKKKKQPKTNLPDIPFALYLQKPRAMYFLPKTPKAKKPDRVQYKFRLRSKASYEEMRMDTDFLQMRKNRHSKQKYERRKCNYKFFKPPLVMGILDPQERALIIKEKTMKKRAVMAPKTGPEINQIKIGGVSYSGDKAKYVIEGVSCISNNNKYIHIDEGRTYVKQQYDSEYKTIIGGFTKYTRSKKPGKKCDCMKLENKVMSHLKKSKCKCEHMFDIYNEGEVREKYLHPATRFGPIWFDEALMYNMDPRDEFIKYAVLEAKKSKSLTPQLSSPMLFAEDLSPKVAVEILLSDLSKSPLIIPHLPKANQLNSLLSWVRRRVHGKLTPEEDKALMLRSERRWMQLNKLDFRARAYQIPFSAEHLDNMTWIERNKLQKLFNVLLEDFTTRNRLLQLEQSRLWWSTMQYDEYPAKPFLDVFCSLLPGRMIDTHLLNPHLLALKKKG